MEIRMKTRGNGMGNSFTSTNGKKKYLIVSVEDEEDHRVNIPLPLSLVDEYELLITEKERLV